MTAPARGTSQIGLAARVELGDEPGAAMVAEAGAIADARQAMRADGVQVAFVQREARLAIGAAAGVVVRPRRAARRAAHHARLVPFRLLDGDDLAAMAAKPAADRALGRIVLAAALRAFDEKAHGQHPGEREGALILHEFGVARVKSRRPTVSFPTGTQLLLVIF